MRASLIDYNRLLKFYVTAVATGAVAVLVVASAGLEWDGSNAFLNGFIAILAVGLAAEVSSVSLHVGSSILSIAYIPFLAATFLFPPIWAMMLGGITVFCVEYFVRKKPWIKVIFNTSKEILAIGLAASAYTLFGGEPSLSSFSFSNPLPYLAAAITFAATNSTSVCYAVSFAEGIEFREVWGRMYGGAVLYDILATPLPALLAYLYVRYSLPGVVGLIVPLFIVRHIYAQNLRLEQSNRELLEMMVKQVELVEPYTSGHSKRVSQYARILARELGLYGKQVEQIATAALLHDVGKVYEEYAPLLRKEGKLTEEERSLLESHPVRSAELVTTISSLRGPVELAVRHHHENYDGTGYPSKLAGKAIPIGARIIMIADTLDAMTTDRPYRKALPLARVEEEFRRYAGTQFDPQIVAIAVESKAIRQLVSQAAGKDTHSQWHRRETSRRQERTLVSR
jgi:putative nucleotidyltransferase with HDIG domain